MAATVAHVAVAVGDRVAQGALLATLELMKMEHPVRAAAGGVVAAVHVAVGDEVVVGSVLLSLTPSEVPARPVDGPSEPARPTEREDLGEVLRRRALLGDGARTEAVAARHARGLRTARENVADLVDEGSFVEYGGLAIAAQRQRRDLEELLERTPADGLVTGIGTVDGRPVAVAAYDATVLAGTQGQTNHRKTDRLLELALARDLPLVLFAEGGGGRPGDTDALGASWLDAKAFALFARLAERVPTVAIVAGYCFAGNAALAGTADLLVAVEGASLAMAGPAMVEGGGLGRHAPEDLGPVAMHAATGAVDVLVADEAAAVDVARSFLALTTTPVAAAGDAPDPVGLRDAVPEDRRRVYDVAALIEGLVDTGSWLELRAAAAPGMRTGFARVHGHAVGVLANDPAHLGGAIDVGGAVSAGRHLRQCDDLGLPVVVLCDTPGFMVGPAAEEEGGVRAFAELFRVGARLRVPLLCVVTRKGYGLGAQAMFGGHLDVPDLVVGWPTSELGPMGLEGAVRLGYRRELGAIVDPDERAVREAELVEEQYARAAGLNVATFAELDDVIDPADTPALLAVTLRAIGRS
jgi:acetyl-CoA carboxylase carboxyltransferase component